MEIDLARNQYQVGRTWKRFPTQGKREPFKLQTTLPPVSSMEKMGTTKTPAWKPEHLLSGKPLKAIPHGKDTTLRSREAVEFCPLAKPGEGTPLVLPVEDPSLRFHWEITGPDDQGEELGGNPKKKTAAAGKGKPMQASPGSIET